MVDCGKISEDVAAQHELMSIAIAFIRLDSLVRALAGPIGEGVSYEATFEDGLDRRAKRMMHNPVAEGGRGNDPFLGIGNADHHVCAGSIAAVTQFPLKRGSIVRVVVAVLDPLPDVAVHVEKAERVRP